MLNFDGGGSFEQNTTNDRLCLDNPSKDKQVEYATMAQEFQINLNIS